MYAKMIVGTDGSETAGRAVATAVRVGEALGAEVLVMHAHERDPGAVEHGGRLLEEVKDRYGVETVLEPGPAPEAIIDLAKVTAAGCVVVGNVGMAGPRRIVLGSVPDKVSHHAGTDVLIVHTVSGDVGVFGRVLLAADGSEGASRAVAAGADLARALGASVVVAAVGLAGEGEGVASEIAAGIRSDLEVAVRSEDGDPGPTLVRIAQEEGCDLIVVGNRRMQGPGRVLGSVPNHVSHHAGCSVLISSAAADPPAREAR